MGEPQTRTESRLARGLCTRLSLLISSASSAHAMDITQMSAHLRGKALQSENTVFVVLAVAQPALACSTGPALGARLGRLDLDRLAACTGDCMPLRDKGPFYSECPGVLSVQKRGARGGPSAAGIRS